MLRSYGDAGRGFLKGAAFDCGSNHHSALSVGFFGHLSCRDKKGAVVVQFDKLKLVEMSIRGALPIDMVG